MQQNIAIVGSGFLGMTLAKRLADAGANVTLFESAGEIGGPASVWRIGDVVWDKHYNVVLASDKYTRSIIEELGLANDLRWVEARVGFYSDGELVSMSNTMDFLKFPPFDLINKIRLGLTIFYASRVKDLRRLEQITVEQWLTKLSGKKTFEKIWKPLLMAKLGEAYEETAASFIWASIQRMYSARRSGMKWEPFGYVRGGFARLLERFGEALVESGVEIRLNSKVEAIERLANGKIKVTIPAARRHHDVKPTVVRPKTKYASFTAASAVAPGYSGAFLTEPEVGTGCVVTMSPESTVSYFDKVIVTCPSNIAAKMLTQIDERESQMLENIRYQGILCASVVLKCSLSKYYVTHITDETPFTGIIEMSAIVDKREFKQDAVVYLPRYAAPDDQLFDKSDDEIETIFLNALEKMYLNFRRNDVVAFKVWRVRQAFSIPLLNYSQSLPDMRTSVEGVYIVNSSHIVNGTVNINETIRLAESFFTRELQKDL
ncbi:MAG: NAD(P)/FAD-dependent oxidoreductase [Pyrinomonadaceae bacterium]